MFFDMINAIDEEGDSDCEIDSWIRPCAPGQGPDNWTSQKIIQVTSFE
jgi:hypothetical protein